MHYESGECEWCLSLWMWMGSFDLWRNFCLYNSITTESKHRHHHRCSKKIQLRTLHYPGLLILCHSLVCWNFPFHLSISSCFYIWANPICTHQGASLEGVCQLWIFYTADMLQFYIFFSSFRLSPPCVIHRTTGISLWVTESPIRACGNQIKNLTPNHLLCIPSWWDCSQNSVNTYTWFKPLCRKKGEL